MVFWDFLEQMLLTQTLVKHYGFSAIFGFTSETIIHKNFTSLNDIEKVSYATLLGSTYGLIKKINRW